MRSYRLCGISTYYFGQPPPTRRVTDSAGRIYTAVVNAFAVVGATVWNSLGNYLRDPDVNVACLVVYCEFVLLKVPHGCTL